MRNPPEKTGILLASILPLAGIMGTIYALYIGSDLWIIPVIMIIMGGLLPLSWAILETLYRPYEVDIGDKNILRYRGRTDQRDIESLKYVFLSPTQSEKYYKRRMDSNVKFHGDEKPVVVTYDVAKAVFDAYVSKTGRSTPPKPGF